METQVFCPIDEKNVIVEENCYLCDLLGGEGNENGKDYILCLQRQQEINDKVNMGDHPKCLGNFTNCPKDKISNCDYKIPCNSRQMVKDLRCA
jgi:hypothetical protein